MVFNIKILSDIKEKIFIADCQKLKESQLILEEEAKLLGKRGESVLEVAIIGQDIQTVKLMAQTNMGFNLNQISIYNTTPFSVAFRKGVEMVKLLHQMGADENATSKCLGSPFSYLEDAVFYQDFELVRYMCEHAKEKNISFGRFYLARVLLAAKGKDNKEIITYLKIVSENNKANSSGFFAQKIESLTHTPLPPLSSEVINKDNQAQNSTASTYCYVSPKSP